MSCSPCSSGLAVTADEADAWTNSAQNLLNSKKGSHLFKEFLIRENLDDGLNHVQFWEKCQSIIASIDKSKGGKSSNLKSEESNIINLCSFADDYVNFDAEQMEILSTIKNEKKAKKVVHVLRQAQQTVIGLLQNEYNFFIEVSKW